MYGICDAGYTMGKTFELIETAEKVARIYMLAAYLPCVNTINDSDLKSHAKFFKVNYRKNFLN